ncbi:hypothetical protein [Dactylosporangium sp. NPDC048998]|uniref:hypothetical protein n=1 Tax=Dactylosporangium sp. NPDC048998 TaxID=3363976 RepID=UPI0037114D19
MAGIVGVHGVWNHLEGRTPQEAAALKSDAWTNGLAQSLGVAPPARVDVAYYAHLLRRGHRQAAPDPETLDDEQRDWLARWDLALNPREEVREALVLKPVRQIISGMARRCNLDTELVALFVTIVLNEIKVYFDPAHPGPRQQVRDTVADTLRRVRPSVVIAHSMGSVVAYETLWQNPDVPVPLLVTLGSPLGLPGVIFPRLAPEPVDGRGSRPPSVARWINVADPGDIIAVPRWLGKSFNGIDEDLETSIDVFDFHKVAKYLKNQKVADAVRPYLDEA